MAEARHHPILSYLRRALGAPASGGVTDAELLRRFVADRDEAAFELLLWRHAATVLHVCRQILRDPHPVEDAFQATFLIFVRKAGSISRRESLGGWLYRVAYRVALKARAQLGKRQPVELTAALAGAAAVAADGADAGREELRQIVCEEVNRLPAKYRAAVVACFLEGRTHEEAAQHLGWPRGTVASRLARARDLLRRRLVRRGLAPSAGALAAAISTPPSEAAVAPLIQSTIQTAKTFLTAPPAGASPRAAAWAEEVLRAMYWTRVKIGAVVLLTSLLAGISATLWATQRSEAEPPEEVAPEPRGGPARAGQPEDAARTAREMAQSRLHLRKLAQAMQAYLEKNGHFPPPAIYGKDGKALLSWRVALLPYLDQNNLYKQFHLDEPWDSPHNREWSNTVPKVYAPPGRPITLPMRTYYQVFVSAPARAGAAPGPGGAGGSAPGGAGPMGGTGASAPPGAGGGAPGVGGPGGPGAPIGGFAAAPGESAWPAAAFVKGRGVGIAHISDGTSNTILIVEAGNPVPWTKPEDLHYATDEPLPELGGLFRDVFHAAFADGSVHTLTKKYNEAHLRTVITANAGDITDYGKIEASPRRGRESPVVEEPSGGGWQQRNDALRRQLERERERLRLLREERDVQREQSARQQSRPTDPHEEALRRENARLQSELDKVRAESEALEKEITRLQKPVQRKGP